jgi:hypothetical protein
MLWRIATSPAPSRNEPSMGHQTRCESLYQLCYPSHHVYYCGLPGIAQSV